MIFLEYWQSWSVETRSWNASLSEKHFPYRNIDYWPETVAVVNSA